MRKTSILGGGAGQSTGQPPTQPQTPGHRPARPTGQPAARPRKKTHSSRHNQPTAGQVVAVGRPTAPFPGQPPDALIALMGASGGFNE